MAATVGCEPPVPPPPLAQPSVVAEFDPLATPPVIPTPNDLAFVGGDGVHLNVPDQPTDSPAQRELNAFLRTLTGFPASSTATAPFSGALDPATVKLGTPVTPGAVLVVDTTAAMPLGPSTVNISLSADGKTLQLSPVTQWAPGHRFAVLVFGGSDAAGLRGAGGETVLASPAFFFLRSPNPLTARCGDAANPDCVCPATAVADPNDTTCHSIVQGLDDATARRVEPQRRMLQAALGLLLPLVAPGRSETNLVVFWTFTITTQAMTVFDPVSGNIPFPNDILINPMTGLVNLPIATGDPQAQLKMALNTFDGFSTSAPETVGVVGAAPVDAATLKPGQTVFLINLDPRPNAPQPIFSAASAFGQIALTPTEPLIPDQDRYAVVVTRAVTDTAGRPLLPAPGMVLLLGTNPLFDGMHSTVNVLSDTQAAQLEMLRQALQPLLAQLAMLGLDRSQIAALWTFTTQSILKPLVALNAYPAMAGLPTDVTILKVVEGPALNAAPFPTTHIAAFITGTFTSKPVADPTTRVITFDRAKDHFSVVPPASAPAIPIRFWMALPKAGGPGPVPVAILQHGLVYWRGQVVGLADGLAALGWATIAFDSAFHGARSFCNADNQCASGTCNKATGACPGGFVPYPTTMDPGACAIQALTGDPADCRPLISGQGFVDLTNVLANRFNYMQYVVDAEQAVRVLSDATNMMGLQALLAAQAPTAPAIDATRIEFLGTSLGGIGGAAFLASEKQPRVAVLNVTGGHLFEIGAEGSFHPLVDQYLMALGVMRGTAAYAQLVATLRWVQDPVDPFSIAALLRGRPIILQEAGMDTTIPPIFQEALAFALFGPMGLDAMHHARSRQNDGTFVSVFFPDANHGTLWAGIPAATSAAMRNQAFTFLTTFGASLPAP